MTALTLEEILREIVRDALVETIHEALEDLPEPANDGPESWRSRIYRVHEETRLNLLEVAKALDCSTRTVRRYINGEGDRHPELPARRGPTGITVRAGDLVQWIKDVEGANRVSEGMP